MTEPHGRIDGYEAPIHRAVWERILTMGAPRLWSTVWLCLCLYAALWFFVALGARWALLPLVAWALGQGLLVVLTAWDGYWMDLAEAQLRRRYRAFYEAG